MLRPPLPWYVDGNAPYDKLTMPFQLFVYNDLPLWLDAAEHEHVEKSLLARLEQLLRGEPGVTLVEVSEQVEKLACTHDIGPFAATLAVGRAGERVARALQERTGWFPGIELAPITRIEVAPGEYRIAESSTAFLEARLPSLIRTPLAIVDDTIYSGLTLTAILHRLTPAQLRQTQVFCLQAIAETLPMIRALCTVHVGLEMPGRMEEEVSVIKASHLFEPGAIRRATGPDLAFYERPEWMQRWFPRAAPQITALCAQLAALQPSHGA